MFEFLQIVLYMPNPMMIAANAASGTKRKMLVFMPICTVGRQGIKLSASVNCNGENADSFGILQQSYHV